MKIATPELEARFRDDLPCPCWEVGRWLADTEEPDVPWRWECWGAGDTKDEAWADAQKLGVTRPANQGENMAAKKKSNGANGAEEGTVKVNRLSKNLRCKLTESEVAERADRAAHLLAERDAIEEDAKAQAAHHKSNLKAKEAELRRLSDQVRDRAEYRDVKCEERLIFRLGKAITVRLDTGETIDERPLTDHEKQVEIDFVKSQAKKSKTKAKAPKAAAAPPPAE